MRKIKGRGDNGSPDPVKPTGMKATPQALTDYYAMVSGESNPVLIARNKHWQYISMYHGNWLQLGSEKLREVVLANARKPRPRPYDQAVLNDLLKVYICVDEAAALAVKAVSGHALGNAKGGNQYYEAMGLTGSSKMSKERQFRIREMATQKLATAYHLDEISASITVMQSSTLLDDIAQYALHRNEGNPDANYVQFFHDKIPSRRIAEFSSTDLLDQQILNHQEDAALLRTRAMLKMFKKDWPDAIKDFSQALAIHKSYPEVHKARGAIEACKGEEFDASGLEAQVLFHRANAYFQIAVNQIEPTLKAYETILKQDQPDSAQIKAESEHLDLRKLVKTNAKKAIRDFLAFMSLFEYSSTVSDQNHYSSLGESSITHIYKISDLFAATPPSSLPQFPPLLSHDTRIEDNGLLPYQSQERLNFHPLLPEAICSFLILNVVTQTPATELRRHTYNAARLIRILKGVPTFTNGKASSSSIWCEILEATDNYIDLKYSWISLTGRNIGLYGAGWLSTEGISPGYIENEGVSKVITESITERKVGVIGAPSESTQKQLQKAVSSSLVDSNTADDSTAILEEIRWSPQRDFGTLKTKIARPVVRWHLIEPLHVDGEKGKKKKKTKKKIKPHESVQSPSTNTPLEE